MKNITDKQIGERLAALRKEKGLTQEKVAAALEMSRNFLSELEAGKKRWLATDVAKYEGFLNVDGGE